LGAELKIERFWVPFPVGLLSSKWLLLEWVTVCEKVSHLGI